MNPQRFPDTMNKTTPRPLLPLSVAQTQERVLLTALGEHLGRSRVTLVELKNREVSTADLKNLQAAADNLVTASRLFSVGIP